MDISDIIEKAKEQRQAPWCDGCGKNRISRIGKPHQLAKVTAPFYLCRYCRAVETRKANTDSADHHAGAWNLVEQQTGTLEKPLPITRA